MKNCAPLKLNASAPSSALIYAHTPIYRRRIEKKCDSFT